MIYFTVYIQINVWECIAHQIQKQNNLDINASITQTNYVLQSICTLKSIIIIMIYKKTNTYTYTYNIYNNGKSECYKLLRCATKLHIRNLQGEKISYYLVSKLISTENYFSLCSMFTYFTYIIIRVWITHKIYAKLYLF